MRANSKVLSMAMAQTQTEHTKSPTMSASAIQWACKNRWISDRFDDVRPDATDGAMSPGLMSARVMGRPLQRSSQQLARPPAKTGTMTGIARIGAGTKGHKAAASRAPTNSRNFARTRTGPATGQTEIPAKLVQTRAQHRPSVPNEARLCLMGG